MIQLSYKNYFQGVFLRDDQSLDKQPLKQQQSQDPALKFLYYWLSH